MSAPRGPAGDRWLRWHLRALGALPAVSFLPIHENGVVTSVLYREPKHAAALAVGWGFLAASAWLAPRLGGPRRRDLWAVLHRTPLLVLSAWLAWLATGHLWTRVPENLAYEGLQLALLFPLLVVLLGWCVRRPEVPRWIGDGLIAGLALATAVGFLQRAVALPWLAPIDPHLGGSFPSLFGYKNPMALALLGQLFLVAERAAGSRGFAALRWGGLLAAELVYLALLGSRSAYLGLVIGAGAWVALTLWRGLRVGADGSSGHAARRWLPIAALVLFAVVLAADPRARLRATSALEVAASPTAYWTSDRGTYLRNTLEMVRAHPLGVGLGDWQTHYPLFRRFDPARSFSQGFQVRRAHSDHVQMLGEGGWPGLVLWSAVLALAALSPARRYWTRGSPGDAWLWAQVVALAAAMATDYVSEMPFHKLQLFLLLVLAFARPEDAEAPAGRRRPSTAVALSVTLVAALHILYAYVLTEKAILSARIGRAYLSATSGAIAVSDPSVPGAVSESTGHLLDVRPLRRVVDLGRRFERTPAVTKTLHRDYLLMASAARLLGDPDTARRWLRRALSLHPFNPKAFLLAAELAREPEEARRLRAIHDRIMAGGVVGLAPGGATVGADDERPHW
ncbi:MAG: O-antigen ligase family protein [Acidobacteriota bacterium]